MAFPRPSRRVRVRVDEVDARTWGKESRPPAGLPWVWAATDDEIELALPCDGGPAAPHEKWFRAVDVEAPSDVAFRWVCQLKMAPYSYDLIDNRARRSPARLTPGADDLEVGQRVMTIFRLTAFVPGESISLVLDDRRALTAFGEIALSYSVLDQGPASCRILVKMLVGLPPGPCPALRRRMLAWGDLAMMRRQLMTLKHRAESTPSD